MKAILRRGALLGAWLLAAGQAGAGEVIGNTYIGERFGYFEMTSVEGKWEMTDKEKSAPNDMAGMVVHFKLKEAVSGWKADVNVTGFKKVDQSISIGFVMEAMRKAWTDQGLETLQAESGRIAGRKVFLSEARGTVKGIAFKGRNIFLEGEKAIFMVAVLAPDYAYPQVIQLLDELVATAKY